jgi:hypothetical protein
VRHKSGEAGKLKENREILAEPYFRRFLYLRSSNFIRGQYQVLIFVLGWRKHIWPRIYADKRG